MRGFRLGILCLAILSLGLGAFGSSGFVPADACCRSAPIQPADDCCHTGCDHCVACSPSLAVVVKQVPLVVCREPLHRVGTVVAGDPRAPEPRDILHVPRAA